jgi:hypothetical protein
MKRPVSIFHLLIITSIVSLSSVLFQTSAPAQTNSWINSGDGAWEDSASWSLVQAPSNTQSILITNDNSKTVLLSATTSGSFPGTMTVTDLFLSASNGATNILALSDAGNLTPLHVLDNLVIAAGGMLLMSNAAVLVDTNGAFSLDGNSSLSGSNLFSGDLYAGFSTNSSASVHLVDGQSLLTNGYTVVGFYGSGQVIVSNGTLSVVDIIVDIVGSTNTGTLANGVFFGLTSGSAGELTVADGKYDSLEHLTLGDEDGSTGSVWVSDGQLISGTNDYLMTIGNNGVGQLILSNGQLAAAYVVVASGPTSQGALMIAGGTGIFSRALSVGVGQGATGTVSITDGRLAVTNLSVILGEYGVGQMTVSDGVFCARTIFVGHNKGSQGMLAISGGITSVASNLVAGMYSNATGVIQVTGGELDVTNQAGAGQLVVGQMGSGAFTQVGGTLIVDQLLATNGTNSVFNFSSGVFNTRSTTVSNSQTFVVGNGSSGATYHLLGGVHSFNDGLRIANAATLSGCGTINGTVAVDIGGRVVADCGGNLTFTGAITNNGILKAVNGSTLESYGLVVNNGVINLLSGHTNFHAGFINNGLVLDESSIPQIVSIQTVGQDVEFWFTTSAGPTYILESRTDLSSGSWVPSLGVVGVGGNVGVFDPGAALLPQKFYRVRLVVPE